MRPLIPALALSTGCVLAPPPGVTPGFESAPRTAAGRHYAPIQIASAGRSDRSESGATRWSDNSDLAEERDQLLVEAGLPDTRWACPLVFVPPGQSVQFEAGPMFDWSGERACAGTDWPSAATPWLALDRDGDGQISSGAELFGTGTRTEDGNRAQHGFEALAELDDDTDGAITPRDSAWSALLLWSDHNRDGRSSRDELRPLDATGLESLSLEQDNLFECGADGNCLGERADVFSQKAPAGQLVDVYLRCR